MDENFLKEKGFGKSYINLLNSEFKNILLERYEGYLAYIEN